MNKAELKSLLLQLSAQANEHRADIFGRMIALVEYAFSDEALSVAQECELCGISKASLYRKNCFRFKPDESSLAETFAPSLQSLPSPTETSETSLPSPTETFAKEKESFPPHPLIKNKEKVSSLRSDTTSACVCTHEGTDDDEARESFSSFCRIYPKTPKGAVLIKAGQLWEELLESGYTAKDIESAVWVSLRSEDWTKENGRFIPRADNFLDRILHPEKEPSIGPPKDAHSAPEGSGYIQVPLDDRGAFSNVAESSVETRFLKAYGRWYKNLYAFNVAWANAKKDVDPELLVFCAEVARDKARERDGDTQYIRLPEEWLRDGRYMDYVKEAEYKKRTSGPSTIDIDAMLGLK